MAENGGRCRFLGFLCKHRAMSYNETLTPIIISAPIIIIISASIIIIISAPIIIFCRTDQFTTHMICYITAIMDVSWCSLYMVCSMSYHSFTIRSYIALGQPGGGAWQYPLVTKSGTCMIIIVSNK